MTDSPEAPLDRLGSLPLGNEGLTGLGAFLEASWMLITDQAAQVRGLFGHCTGLLVRHQEGGAV